MCSWDWAVVWWVKLQWARSQQCPALVSPQPPQVQNPISQPSWPSVSEGRQQAGRWCWWKTTQRRTSEGSSGHPGKAVLESRMIWQSFQSFNSNTLDFRQFFRIVTFKFCLVLLTWSLPPFAKCIHWLPLLIVTRSFMVSKGFLPALWIPSKERHRFTRSTKLQSLVIILSTVCSHNWMKGESVAIFMLMFIAGFPDHFRLWVKCWYIFHCLKEKLSGIFVTNRKDLQITFPRKLRNFWSGRV